MGQHPRGRHGSIFSMNQNSRTNRARNPRITVNKRERKANLVWQRHPTKRDSRRGCYRRELAAEETSRDQTSLQDRERSITNTNNTKQTTDLGKYLPTNYESIRHLEAEEHQ